MNVLKLSSKLYASRGNVARCNRVARLKYEKNIVSLNCRKLGGEIDRKTERKRDRKTEGQRDRQKNRETDRVRHKERES
jgi:hypothetical protein